MPIGTPLFMNSWYCVICFSFSSSVSLPTDRLIELHSITIPVAVAHEKSRP